MLEINLIPLEDESLNDFRDRILPILPKPNIILTYFNKNTTLSSRRYKVFLSKLRQIQECWIWMGGKVHNGYGFMLIGGNGGKQTRTHRLAYSIWKGDIEEDLQCLHECDIRECCNPKHLFLGTPQRNTQDMMDRGRNKYENKFKVDEDIYEKMKFLKSQNLSNVKIGERLNLSYETVRQYLNGEKRV